MHTILLSTHKMFRIALQFNQLVPASLNEQQAIAVYISQ
jgi:hypothetical protein